MIISKVLKSSLSNSTMAVVTPSIGPCEKVFGWSYTQLVGHFVISYSAAPSKCEAIEGLASITLFPFGRGSEPSHFIAQSLFAERGIFEVKVAGPAPYVHLEHREEMYLDPGEHRLIMKVFCPKCGVYIGTKEYRELAISSYGPNRSKDEAYFNLQGTCVSLATIRAQCKHMAVLEFVGETVGGKACGTDLFSARIVHNQENCQSMGRIYYCQCGAICLEVPLLGKDDKVVTLHSSSVDIGPVNRDAVTP